MRIRPLSSSAAPRTRTGAALQIAAGAVAASALVWFGVAYDAAPTAPTAPFPLAPSAAVSVRPDFEPPTNVELADALLSSGLGAPALTAAGLSGPQITTLVGRARTHLEAHIQELRDAEEQIIAAQTTYDSLRRRIESGFGSQGDVANFVAATAALNEARASRQTVLNALIASSVAGLPFEVAATLATLRTNSGWELPTQYGVVNHGETDWIALRDAIANDTISARRGEDPDPDAHAYLLQAQADPTVAAATANLQNLAPLNLAWNQAVGIP
jgi:hypothetical protein